MIFYKPLLHFGGKISLGFFLMGDENDLVSKEEMEREIKNERYKREKELNENIITTQAKTFADILFAIKKNAENFDKKIVTEKDNCNVAEVSSLCIRIISDTNKALDLLYPEVSNQSYPNFINEGVMPNNPEKVERPQPWPNPPEPIVQPVSKR